MTIVAGVVQPDYDVCVDAPVGNTIIIEGPEGPPGPPGTSCPLFCGTGSPEGVVTSPIGGIYEQTDAASTSHSIWFKHSGTGNTGWRGWAGMRGGNGANNALRMGDNSVASGDRAIAIGDDAEATKADSISIGSSTADSERFINLGHRNVAPVNDGLEGMIVIGYDNDAATLATTEDELVVIGLDNDVGIAGFGGPLVVIGDNNWIVGAELVAIGSFMLGSDGVVAGSSVADPTYGVLLGTEAEAQADCFIAAGYQSKAYGIGATAVGPHTRAGDDADSLHTTALGRFATARADQGLALGSGTTVAAAHTSSIALGHGATTNAVKQLMIGAAAAGSNILAVHFNGSATPLIVADGSGNAAFNGNVNPPSTTLVLGTLLNSGHGTVRVDATVGGLTIDLPPAASVPNKVYTIIKVDVSGNAVTIDADGGELINGATTFPLAAQFDKVVIQSNGTSWDIIG